MAGLVPGEIVIRHMAVLVTRPLPDNEATAAALRARGFEAMSAPMLRFEPVPFSGLDGDYGAVIVTSANALRAVEGQLGEGLLKLPLLAVGETTAAAARKAGFAKVIAADGEAGALRDLVLASVSFYRFRAVSPSELLAPSVSPPLLPPLGHPCPASYSRWSYYSQLLS